MHLLKALGVRELFDFITVSLVHLRPVVIDLMLADVVSFLINLVDLSGLDVCQELLMHFSRPCEQMLCWLHVVVHDVVGRW